jgi:hypothetical protein
LSRLRRKEAIQPTIANTGACRSPAGQDASGFSWPIPAASGHVASNAMTTYAPTTALGKRRREAEEPQGDGGLVGINAHDVPPQKRARGGTSGILKAKRSAAGTRHNLVARIPKTRFECKPKEAGRGAERLATPSAHGIYHQSSPGPSFQQGWAVEPADGKPNWVEGSVDEDAAHRIDSTVQQQQEEATELFKIPRKFKPGYRLLLQASEADFARGAVQTIKCRLCPDTKLKDFEEFKRHCKTMETHPLELHFCDRCGDYFARSDSLKRHHKTATRVPQGHAGEGCGEAQGDGGGARGLHPAVGVCLDNGRGYRQVILANHQGEISRVFEEAHPAVSSGVGSRDATYPVRYFHFSFVCLCPVSVAIASRSPWGEVPWMVCFFALVLNFL